MYHLDLLANSYLEKYRNLFVLGCLIGFRFRDYSDIKPEEVREPLFSDSNNDELLIIYLATIRGRRNTIFPPAQSRTVVRKSC